MYLNFFLLQQRRKNACIHVRDLCVFGILFSAHGVSNVSWNQIYQIGLCEQ